MPDDAGLTPFAWVFMIFSMLSVTGLTLWCFYRILTTPGEFSAPEPGSGSGEVGRDRGPRSAPEA